MLFRNASFCNGLRPLQRSPLGHARPVRRSYPPCARPGSILRARPPHGPRGPLNEERALAYPYSLACAFQKLNKQLTDLLRLLLLKPVSRAINKMSTAHLGAGGALHALERAGNLENTPVALSAYE